MRDLQPPLTLTFSPRRGGERELEQRRGIGRWGWRGGGRARTGAEDIFEAADGCAGAVEHFERTFARAQVAIEGCHRAGHAGIGIIEPGVEGAREDCGKSGNANLTCGAFGVDASRLEHGRLRPQQAFEQRPVYRAAVVSRFHGGFVWGERIKPAHDDIEHGIACGMAGLAAWRFGQDLRVDHVPERGQHLTLAFEFAAQVAESDAGCVCNVDHGDISPLLFSGEAHQSRDDPAFGGERVDHGCLLAGLVHRYFIADEQCRCEFKTAEWVDWIGAT